MPLFKNKYKRKSTGNIVDRALILYNSNSQYSIDIAKYYYDRRYDKAIFMGEINEYGFKGLGLDLPEPVYNDDYTLAGSNYTNLLYMTLNNFLLKIATPLINFITPYTYSPNYIILSKDIPALWDSVVELENVYGTAVSVDFSVSRIAKLKSFSTSTITSSISRNDIWDLHANRTYINKLFDITDLEHRLVRVGRLEGTTPDIVYSLIDKSIQADSYTYNTSDVIILNAECVSTSNWAKIPEAHTIADNNNIEHTYLPYSYSGEDYPQNLPTSSNVILYSDNALYSQYSNTKFNATPVESLITTGVSADTIALTGRGPVMNRTTGIIKVQDEGAYNTVVNTRNDIYTSGETIVAVDVIDTTVDMPLYLDDYNLIGYDTSGSSAYIIGTINSSGLSITDQGDYWELHWTGVREYNSRPTYPYSLAVAKNYTSNTDMLIDFSNDNIEIQWLTDNRPSGNYKIWTKETIQSQKLYDTIEFLPGGIFSTMWSGSALVCGFLGKDRYRRSMNFTIHTHTDTPSGATCAIGSWTEPLGYNVYHVDLLLQYYLSGQDFGTTSLISGLLPYNTNIGDPFCNPFRNSNPIPRY